MEIKWKHFPRYWPFVRGIHRSPVNSPHKGQWRGALMFSLICTRINGWVKNREAGDLRRHRAPHDVIVIVMSCTEINKRNSSIKQHPHIVFLWDDFSKLHKLMRIDLFLPLSWYTNGWEIWYFNGALFAYSVGQLLRYVYSPHASFWCIRYIF